MEGKGWEVVGRTHYHGGIPSREFFDLRISEQDYNKSKEEDT